MRLWKAKWGALFLVYATLIACQQEDVLPVSSRVFFSVSEAYPSELDGVEPAICLNLRTEKIYGSISNMLIADFELRDSVLAVHVLGVRRCGFCLDSPGPARWKDYVALEEGVYTLDISRGASRSVYTLEVTPNALNVSLPLGEMLTEFALPEFQSWWRYPKNSFEYVCNTAQSTAWIYEDFIMKLRAAVELQEIEFPAYGEFGYVRQSDNPWPNHPVRYFVYASEDDFQMAGEVLRTYAREIIGQLPGITIILRNWRNERYRSWMMDSEGPSKTKD